MTGLLAAGLGLPLLAALVTVIGAVIGRPARARTVATVVSGLAAVSWAVVVASDAPPELGRVVADPLAACAVAGLALLATVHLPTRPLAACGALCGITVVAVGATTDATAGGSAERPLAAATLALVALVVVQARADAVPAAVLVATGLGGIVAASGLAVDPTDTVAAGVVLGTAVVLVASMWCPPAVVLVPVVALAVARIVPAPSAITAGFPADGATRSAIAGVVVAAAGTAAIATRSGVVSRLRRPGARTPRSRSGRSSVAPGVPMTDQNVGGRRLGGSVAAWAPVLAGTVLLTQDLTGFRSAGLLLVAGGVLALVSTHPAALIAVVPGLAAGVDALGSPRAPVEVAAGVGAGAVLVAGLFELRTDADATGRDWRLVAPVAFGCVPLWGWSGAELDGYSSAVATAAAAGIAVVVFVVLVAREPSCTDRPASRSRRGRR